MKRLQKRMLAILLSLLMVLSIIPVTVLSAAADDTATFSVYIVPVSAVGNRLQPTLISDGKEVVNENYGAPFELTDGTDDSTNYKVSSGLSMTEALSVNYTVGSEFKVISLENGTNGTPAVLSGDYNIPAYTIVLIPNNDGTLAVNPVLYTTKPGDITYNTMESMLTPMLGHKPSSNEVWTTVKSMTTAVRTLEYSGGTMSFTAGSACSVGGYYYAANVQEPQYLSGTPLPSNAVVGPFAKLALDKTANINFTGYGTQYPCYMFAWGFVTGEGSVDINSGASVFEDFQLSDFPDLNTALKMMERPVGGGNVSGVFPVSQYYVQNIESTLNIHQGGLENIHACLSLGSSPVPIEVPFVGNPKVNESDPQAMFTITSGYITKVFDSTTNKTSFIINGDSAISNLQMDLIKLYSIDSALFQLPISNIDIVVKDGSTLTTEQDLQLLPYASIKVEENATLDMYSSIYVVDAAEEGERVYPGTSDVLILTTSEGFDITRTKDIENAPGAELIVDGTAVIHPEYPVTKTINNTTYNYTQYCGIAYVGDVEISGDGSIINYSTAEIPPMNVMAVNEKGESVSSLEDAELEAVRDETGEIIANNANTPVSEATAYKYSDEYDVWYVDGQKITIIFKVNADIGDFDNVIAPEKVYETKVVDFGSSVTFPEPTKDDDYRYTDYNLTGWTSSNPTADKNPNVAIANTTYTAQFEGTPAECAVYFFPGDSDEDFENPLEETSAYYDSHPVYTGAEPDGGNTKDFIGWSYTTYYWIGDEEVPEPGNEIITTAGLEDFIVKGATDFCAVFSNKSFKVDWLDKNGTIVNPTAPEIPYGESTHYGDQNIKDNIDYSDGYYDYAVSGWSCTYTDVNTGEVETVVISRNDYLTVKGNTTCTPIFTATPKDGANPFIQKSLTLNGAIGANFLIQLPDGYSADDCKVDFSWGDSKTYSDTSLVPYSETAAVATVEIAPKEMMDTITATLKKGDQVIASTTYHVADYAVDVIEDKDNDGNGVGDITEALKSGTNPLSDEKIDQLKALCRSILWYGRKAQEQFNYTLADTDLVAEIDELLSGYAPAEPSALEPITYTADQFPAGISYYGSSMFLESETVYQLWFSCTPGQNPPKAYLVDGEKETELQYDADILARYNGRYTYYRINDIPAKEITDNLEIRFEGGDTVTFNAATYIAKAYADYDDPTTKTTVTALYDYNQKAIAFFGR